MGLYLPSPVDGRNVLDWLEHLRIQADAKIVEPGSRPPTVHRWGDFMVVVVFPAGNDLRAAVLYSQSELRRWTAQDDPRPKGWYQVRFTELLRVAPELTELIEQSREDERMSGSRTGAMFTHIETVSMGKLWLAVQRHMKRTGSYFSEKKCKEFQVIWHKVGRRATLCEIMDDTGRRVSVGIAHRSRNCQRCGTGGDKPNGELGQELAFWRALTNIDVR